MRGRISFKWVAWLAVLTASAVGFVVCSAALNPSSLLESKSTVSARENPNWVALSYTTVPLPPKSQEAVPAEGDLQYEMLNHKAAIRVSPGPETTTVEVRVTTGDVVTALAASGKRINTVVFWLPGSASIEGEPCAYWADGGVEKRPTQSSIEKKVVPLNDKDGFSYARYACAVYYEDDSDEIGDTSHGMVTLTYSVKTVSSQEGNETSMDFAVQPIFHIAAEGYANEPGRTAMWEDTGGTVTLEVLSPEGRQITAASPPTVAWNRASALSDEPSSIRLVHRGTLTDIVLQVGRDLSLLAFGTAVALLFPRMPRRNEASA